MLPVHCIRANRQSLPAPFRGGGRRPRSGREVGVVDSPMEKTSSVRCSRRGGHKPARAPIPSSARQVTLASPQDKGSRCWKLPGIVDPWRLTGGRRCGRVAAAKKQRDGFAPRRRERGFPVASSGHHTTHAGKIFSRSPGIPEQIVRERITATSLYIFKN